MNDEFVGATKEQIKSLFENDEKINKRIDKLETEQSQLKEITTILKITQKQYEDHHKLIEKMHDNLIELNGTVRNLQSDMDNVKGQVESIQESGKFDMRQFGKTLLYTVLPTAIGTFIIAFLVYYFGWK